jgi:hypothetical protein
MCNKFKYMEQEFVFKEPPANLLVGVFSFENGKVIFTSKRDYDLQAATLDSHQTGPANLLYK